MESVEGIIIEILGKKPSSAREIVKELKKDTKKGEVNSVLYSLLKKGVVEKSDTLPPIWSVAQKKTKVLVTIGFQSTPDWLEKAGSLADQHKKVLFFVDRKIRTPKGVENHYLEDMGEVSMTTRVVIELTRILCSTKDVEIIFSSTNARWGSMLKQLDETFGMKWIMVYHDWEEVRKHFE